MAFDNRNAGDHSNLRTLGLNDAVIDVHQLAQFVTRCTALKSFVVSSADPAPPLLFVALAACRWPALEMFECNVDDAPSIDKATILRLLVHSPMLNNLDLPDSVEVDTVMAAIKQWYATRPPARPLESLFIGGEMVEDELPRHPSTWENSYSGQSNDE